MDYQSPEWVAERLGLDKNTVYKFLQDGLIPAVQLGRKWLVSEAQLEKWLADEAQRQTQARRQASESTEKTLRRMDNFAPDARQVLRLAHAEARRYAHPYLGQEHLLLGFAAVPDSPASRALAGLGVSFDAIRAAIEKRLAPGNGPAPRRLGRTPRAKAAMKLAVREAAKSDSPAVGADHLLLGILLCGEGLGYEILGDLGVTGDVLRNQLSATDATHNQELLP